MSYIQPDWLLIWEQRDAELILILTDTGLHSDLFGKGGLAIPYLIGGEIGMRFVLRNGE